MRSNVGNITIRNANLPGKMRNFTGKETQYNAEGSRNFCVLVDPELGERLAADGWNVKYLRPLEGEEVGAPYIQVTVKYGKGRPPRIVAINGRGDRQELDEDLVEMLDWAEFANVDLIIRPYSWDINGKQGITAYLKTMFVTIAEDELEAEYAQSPSSGLGQQQDLPDDFN